MSALTGAFEGLGRGISKEADRKLKKWDDERVLAEQEKLIIAREKRIDAAARLRQTNQNTYTAGVNKITRTQKLIDDATAQADRIKLQEIKNEGLIGAQKAKNNATRGGEGPLGELTLIPTKVYDPTTGITTTTNQIFSHGLGRIVGQDEINSGVYLSEEQRHAAATKLSKDKDKDKDKDKHTTNPLLDEVDKNLPEDTPSDTPSDTSDTGLINTDKKQTVGERNAENWNKVKNSVINSTEGLVNYFFNNPSKQPTTEAQRVAKAEAERQLKIKRRNRTGRGAGSGRV
jgi:hypothetical protein